MTCRTFGHSAGKAFSRASPGEVPKLSWAMEFDKMVVPATLTARKPTPMASTMALVNSSTHRELKSRLSAKGVVISALFGMAGIRIERWRRWRKPNQRRIQEGAQSYERWKEANPSMRKCILDAIQNFRELAKGDERLPRDPAAVSWLSFSARVTRVDAQSVQSVTWP